jgi:hypothetical protein
MSRSAVDAAADVASMLGDWDTAIIGGRAYQGVFNHEAFNLGDVERIPSFTMRTADVTAANVVRDTKLKVGDDTWVVRDLQRNDDGNVTTLILAAVMT